MINSTEIWDLTQQRVITIGPDKVNQSDLSVPGKKRDLKKKKSAHRARALSGPVIYPRCAFLRQWANIYLNIWEEFCAIKWPL